MNQKQTDRLRYLYGLLQDMANKSPNPEYLATAVSIRWALAGVDTVVSADEWIRRAENILEIEHEPLMVYKREMNLWTIPGTDFDDLADKIYSSGVYGGSLTLRNELYMWDNRTHKQPIQITVTVEPLEMKVEEKVEDNDLEYTVVSDEFISHLVERIKEEIQKGWKPHGSITNSRNGDYIQAMTRKKPK